MAWISPDEWHQLKAGVRCPMCADIHLEENEFSHLVTDFEHTYVRMPKNQFRRGWTLVVLKRHASELYELTELELSAFWRDVTLVAGALGDLYQPAKVNCAVYGNLCPHLHCHLVLQILRRSASAREHERRGSPAPTRRVSAGDRLTEASAGC
jgi:diadenosine tetraphosphate (Ap4A) HIT family hydrolase